jgi:hypothetical protein
MIQADKQLIQSQLKLSSLKVREKELTFYNNNFETLATVAALLSGFAFSALQNNIPTDTHWVISLLFHSSFPVAVMYSLWCVCNSTFISMFGPGLALRGTDGSMHKAVEGMMTERIELYNSFRMSILALHIATACCIWGYREHNVAGWLDGTTVCYYKTSRVA